MDADIIIEDPRWSDIDLDTLARRAGAAVAAHLGLEGGAEYALLACDDMRIATLNADFRGKPQPTNVLSWPETDLSPEEAGARPAPPQAHPLAQPLAQPLADPGEALFLGDIAMAWDTCAREAAEAGKPMADHVIHLLVHGLLHLLGYDHIRDLDATLMEGIETEILGKLGIPDPYSGDGAA